MNITKMTLPPVLLMSLAMISIVRAGNDHGAEFDDLLAEAGLVRHSG